MPENRHITNLLKARNLPSSYTFHTSKESVNGLRCAATGNETFKNPEAPSEPSYSEEAAKTDSEEAAKTDRKN